MVVKGQMFLSAYENKKAKPEIFSPWSWSPGFSLVERQVLVKLYWNRLRIDSPEKIFEIINNISLTSLLEISRTW